MQHNPLIGITFVILNDLCVFILLSLIYLSLLSYMFMISHDVNLELH